MDWPSTIILLIVLWFPAFYLHERCHKWEAKRQGTDSYIKFWWHKIWHIPIPSMQCIPTDPLKNRYLFYLSGGLYSGLILLSLGILLFFIESLSDTLVLLGSVNVVYSLYEVILLPMVHDGKLSMKNYMRWHYVLFAVVLIVVGFFLASF